MQNLDNKFKIWLISRLDQATLLARYLKDNNQLIRWDTFIRFSKNSFLAKKNFIGSRRIVDEDLLDVPGNHYLPEILGKIGKFFKFKDFQKIADIKLAEISVKKIPKEFDILHGQGNYSLESGIEAQKRGKIFISEVSGQMGITRFNQLKDLYKKFNLPLQIGLPILQKRRLTEAQISDAIICPSEIVKKELTKIGIADDKIYIVRHDSPISKELLLLKSKSKESKQNLHILNVGRVSIDKGIHHTIAIQKRLKKEGIKSELHLVGPIIDNFLTKNTENQNIFFHGKVNKERLKKFYDNADIFLFPTYTEGAALSTFEAMAAELPVITTTSAGSIVENNVCGFVCSNGDEEEMYKQTLKLATNINLRKEMAINSRITYKKKMIHGYGKSVCLVYEEILKKNKKNVN